MNFLKKGDVVDIIAPSGGLNISYVQDAVDLLENLGLKARYDANIIDLDKGKYCANTDEERFSQLVYALTNDESKGIFPIRGGFGTSKLIPNLLKINKPEFSKILLGFSDITALHIFVAQEWDWVSVHGRLIGRFIIGDDEKKITIDTIFGNIKELKYEIYPLNEKARNTDYISSKVIGGNLCLIQASIGTDWQINTKDKILLIEDVHEPGYKIDRTLTHLLQAHVFDDISALLFGDFTDSYDEKDELVQYALDKFIYEQKDIPIYKINYVGHAQINNPIVLNSHTTIEHIANDWFIEMSLI